MIFVQLTNGFGNNLFQYNAAKLLARYHNTQVVAIPPTRDYYAIPCLKSLGVNIDTSPEKLPSMIRVNEGNYKDLFNNQYSGFNFFVSGYFEDYTFFRDSIEIIKTWFPTVQNRNNKDLVIHFRTGDRLFYKNEFDTKPTLESYLRAINKFEFENLHIVTDMPSWKRLTEFELQNMRFHRHVPESESVPINKSVDYFNSFVDGLSVYNPRVSHRSAGEDFQFIRTFDNILFQHGTLGWWAAALSEASSVGVYGPWRPWKGPSNKNLSNINLKGWFKWE